MFMFIKMCRWKSWVDGTVSQTAPLSTGSRESSGSSSSDNDNHNMMNSSNHSLLLRDVR